VLKCCHTVVPILRVKGNLPITMAYCCNPTFIRLKDSVGVVVDTELVCNCVATVINNAGYTVHLMLSYLLGLS